jgi:hypothetical protein
LNPFLTLPFALTNKSISVKGFHPKSRTTEKVRFLNILTELGLDRGYNMLQAICGWVKKVTVKIINNIGFMVCLPIQ